MEIYLKVDFLILVSFIVTFNLYFLGELYDIMDGDIWQEFRDFLDYPGKFFKINYLKYYICFKYFNFFFR